MFKNGNQACMHQKEKRCLQEKQQLRRKFII